MAALGVGLIGTGYMGKCHALAWNNATSVFGDVERPRLVTLAEVNPELAAKKAAEFGFARSTGNWRDLLSDPEIDVISVTTPNAFHPEMAIAALEAGSGDRRDTGQAVLAVDVHAVGATDAFTAGAAVGEAFVLFLDQRQYVEDHDVLAAGVDLEVLHERSGVLLRVVAINTDLQHISHP